MKLLIVEDHPKLRENILRICREAGYFADGAIHGEEALQLIHTSNYHGIILDMNLPIKSGRDCILELRKEQNSIPILVLTSNNFSSDMISTLDIGADDYMTKPFEPDELLARIRALLRRKGEIIMKNLFFEDLIIYRDTHKVFLHQKELILPAKEWQMLLYLSENRERYIKKEELFSEIWGEHEPEFASATKTVEMCISRLRKHLEVPCIESIRNLGYKITLYETP